MGLLTLVNHIEEKYSNAKLPKKILKEIKNYSNGKVSGVFYKEIHSRTMR